MEDDQNYSTLKIYYKYFTFLQVVGVFPFKINFDRKTQSLKEISIHKEGIFYYLNKIVVTFSVLYTLLAFLIFLNYTERATRVYAISHVSWTLVCLHMCIIIVTFNLKKVKLCKLLNEWIQIQSALVQGKAKYFLFSGRLSSELRINLIMLFYIL